MLRRTAETAAAGALAGTAGTLAHSAVMLSGHAYSRRARREPIPPRQLAVTAARRALPSQYALTEPRVVLGTVLLHFGYGIAAGTAYTALMLHPHQRPLARGVTYGVGIWAASYLGWIPALRMPPPATRQSPQQNLTMVLAHIAWGAALGATAARFTPSERSAQLRTGDTPSRRAIERANPCK